MRRRWWTGKTARAALFLVVLAAVATTLSATLAGNGVARRGVILDSRKSGSRLPYEEPGTPCVFRSQSGEFSRT